MSYMERLKLEIENHLGFFPAHFQPLMATPAMLEHVWKLQISVYAAERIPLHFKEKSFAYLSRFVKSPYFLVCQASGLKELKMTGPEIYEWLKKAPLSDFNFQKLREIFRENSREIDNWPSESSLLEKALFESLTLLYHKGFELHFLLDEIRRVLGPVFYNDFLNLLIFVKTSHEIAQAFRDISPESDKRVRAFKDILLNEEPRLKDFFKSYYEKAQSELLKIDLELMGSVPLSNLHPEYVHILNKKLQSELDAAKKELMRLGQEKTSIQNETKEGSLENIFKTAPDIIYRLDQDGNFIYINDTVQALGFKPHELLGKHFSLILHEEDVQTASRSRVLPAYAGEHTGDKNAPKLFDERRTGDRMTKDLEVRLLGKKGSETPSSFYYYGEVNSCGFYDQAPSDKKEFLGTVGIIRNTTEKRKMEKTRDGFLSTVSHELRTPAAVIKEAVYSLREGLAGPLTEDQMGFVELADRNANRLSKIINNILDLSRLESRKVDLFKKEISLEKIIHETLANYGPVSKDKILSIEIQTTHSPLNIQADEDLITVVFNNLLDNAIRFAQSKVIVQGAFIDENGSKAAEKTNRVLISVMDDGPGIDPLYMKNLFNKYTQINRPRNNSKYKGTGLGLVICKEIIHLHSGKIWVESYPHQGAYFHFILPVSPPAAQV